MISAYCNSISETGHRRINQVEAAVVRELYDLDPTDARSWTLLLYWETRDITAKRQNGPRSSALVRLLALTTGSGSSRA